MRHQLNGSNTQPDIGEFSKYQVSVNLIYLEYKILGDFENIKTQSCPIKNRINSIGYVH